MKPVAESSKAADTERFEAAVGVWKPTDQKKTGDASQHLPPIPHNINQVGNHSNGTSLP